MNSEPEEQNGLCKGGKEAAPSESFVYWEKTSGQQGLLLESDLSMNVVYKKKENNLLMPGL